jgi:hypothetical protein
VVDWDNVGGGRRSSTRYFALSSSSPSELEPGAAVDTAAGDAICTSWACSMVLGLSALHDSLQATGELRFMGVSIASWLLGSRAMLAPVLRRRG